MMRAIVFDRFGEPADVLQVRESPEPVPSPGEIRVRMLAAPVNPSDLMVVRGVYGRLPPLPATPGLEGVGVVEANGGGWLGKFLLGKRVAVLNSRTGSWAEKAVLPVKQAIPLSSRLSVEQGAMFFVNPATAYIMTREILRVPPGEWLLQTAAGSAVGRMIIRLGKRFGFKTINIVRRGEQKAELQALGADVVIAESDGDVAAQVRNAVGDGVRYVVDPVGGKTASAVVRSLARGGRMLVFGTLSPDPLSFSPRELMVAAASIEGFWLSNWMSTQKLVNKLRLRSVLTKLILDGTLASDVGGTYEIDAIAAAVHAAEKPARDGKVLLKLSEW
ncbi:MAG: zinc-dependent alcohol dehydrogenase family protein [Planctomycetaceae bacterium]